MSFASTLLDEHKAALTKQASNTLSTNEEYSENDVENDLTFSNRENYNIHNNNSSERMML